MPLARSRRASAPDVQYTRPPQATAVTGRGFACTGWTFRIVLTIEPTKTAITPMNTAPPSHAKSDPRVRRIARTYVIPPPNRFRAGAPGRGRSALDDRDRRAERHELLQD